MARRNYGEFIHQLDREIEARKNKLASMTSTAIENTIQVDLHETDSTITILANLPGIDMTKTRVFADKNRVTIKAETHQALEFESGKYHKKERVERILKRAVTLPAAVKQHEARATYNRGILRIIIPKLEKADPKEVKIKIIPNKKRKIKKLLKR